MKIKNRSRKRSHKRDGIGVRRIRTFPFLPTPLTTPSLTFRLWSGENQIVGVGSRSGRINQGQGTFPHFVIGLALLLLLPTPTIWFSLDHKLYASDYDSDSVVGENQPLAFHAHVLKGFDTRSCSTDEPPRKSALGAYAISPMPKGFARYRIYSNKLPTSN